VPNIKTQDVQISANGESLSAFVARPEGGGPFPGLIVIQEWWGLESHIKDVTQRFATEGFVALAPDLYHGQVATEPSEAQKMMMSLDMPRAGKELVKAVDYLTADSAVSNVGAIGYCMGGGLALTLACNSAKVKAVAPYYGANPNPIGKVKDIQGPIFAVYAENDHFINEQVREALKGALQQHGKKFEMNVYPGTGHAFFNDTRPDIYDAEAAKDVWGKTLSFFRANL